MKQYTPLASKSFGTDTDTGLEKQLVAHTILISAVDERIDVLYDVVLMSPTGLMVSVVESSRYIRDNSGNNPKYDQLHDSDLGKGIMAIIQNDLNGITSYATINDDLLQTNSTPIQS